MPDSYEVLPYTIERFLDLCDQYSEAFKAQITEKLHKTYFEGYFSGIQAKTIIVEKEYVDRDYLEDYVSYYVKCFQPYDRYCTRLHFFNKDFTETDFKTLLSGDLKRKEDFEKSYLGFIVVKPLPKTIFGRTCLKTYPHESRRYFPVSKKYDVNLFGLSLQIETLAYQEQDQVAAACATSALWSIFHGTGDLFHHPIPTPIEITKAATLNLPNQRRNLPNNGLTLEQMAHAIRTVGLEPYPVNVEKNIYVLKSTIYAYLRSGLPIAMAVVIVDHVVSPPVMIGWHAVAITGFSLGGTVNPLGGITGFLSQSSKIDKIYVHDDQIGPFARMGCDNRAVTVDLVGSGTPRNYYSLSSSWKDTRGNIGGARAIPIAILLPLYHKIRIPLAVIEEIIIGFDTIIELLRTNNIIPLSDRLVWDISLSALNSFKKDILCCKHIENAHREEILTSPLPRFIWRAIASSDNNPIIELVFDATDIEQGNFFLMSVKYNPIFYQILRSIPNISVLLSTNPSRTIFEAIQSKP